MIVLGNFEPVKVFELYGSVDRPKSECVWIVLFFEQGTQVLV